MFGEKGVVDVKLRRDVQKFDRSPLIFVGELVMPRTNHDADVLDPLLYFLGIEATEYISNKQPLEALN